ncbi:MAG: hypothetical protein ACTSWN_11085, partial [Promethearchaeota archaeon]
MAINYKDQMNIQKVEDFLRQRGLKYYLIPNNSISIPYNILGREFFIRFELHKQWGIFTCLIVRLEDLPIKSDIYLKELYYKLLFATFQLPEVNYAVDENFSVYVNADVPIEMIDANNFYSEFFALPFGVKYFIEKIGPSMVP